MDYQPHDFHSSGRRELTLVTAPTALPITLAQAKQQLRVDFTDDDDFIGNQLIPAVVGFLDPGAAGGYLGMALCQQQWKLTLDRFPGAGLYQRWSYPPFHYPISEQLAIDLPYPPLISVDSLKYIDDSGTLQTMDPSLYQVTAIKANKQKGRIAPAPATIWPLTLIGKLDAVQITYTCGFANVTDIPWPIKHAMMLLVSHFYENRDAAFIAERSRAAVVELPIGVDALLANYRVHY